MHSPKTGQAKGELTHNTDDAHRRSGSGPCARPRILPFCLRRPSLPLRRCEVSLTVLQLIFIFIFFFSRIKEATRRGIACRKIKGQRGRRHSWCSS